MQIEQDQRRDRLVELMGRHGLDCGQLGSMVDREAHTVRCWRSGNQPMSDHTLALIELLLRHGYHRRAT